MTSREARIELALKLIATCIALFGVGKYFHELALERRLAAKSAALERIQSFTDENMNNARKLLFDFWLEHPQAVAVLHNRPTSSAAYSNFLLPAFSVAQESTRLFDAVYLLTQHYDYVYFCLDSGLCDEKIMHDFYCPKVLVTRNVYYPIITSLKGRSGYTNFGLGLERLAEQCESIAGLR